MDRLLRRYLKQQSTKKLDAILEYCLNQAYPEDYADVIRLILNILHEREHKTYE